MIGRIPVASVKALPDKTYTFFPIIALLIRPLL